MTVALTENIETYLARHQKKELLRFLTCGSVDDGKSTLIGRLLHDTKTIYEDQLAAVTRDSVKHGTTGAGEVDLALLTDGLKAEREQGITIDVAYRYFSTDKRKFIIADTPGHEQYTRNMATGASTAQLAIILIDARYGVVTQTRRHSYIVNLLGIKHIIVAVNKMDLVGWSQEVFEKIKADYLAFTEKLESSAGITTRQGAAGKATFIPMSALKGDNVVEPSAHMPWYTGGALLGELEHVPLAVEGAGVGLRFPVQYVLRPNLDFRGFAGTLASGIVRRGDEIAVLPSGKKSRVKSIVTWEGELEEARGGEAVTLTLEDEIDVSRGDMLVHARPEKEKGEGEGAMVGREFEAMVVWMHEQPLVVGRGYWIKQTTRVTAGEVVEIRHAVDVNTLEQRKVEGLKLNEVGRVVLATQQPLVFDAYGDNAATGAFIIIDRLTNNTVAAGMIVGLREQRGAKRGAVSVNEKETRWGQHGAVVWVESKDAVAVERMLFDEWRTVVRVEAEEAGAWAVARVASEQGIVVVVGAERAPSVAERTELGARLVMAETRNWGETISALRQRGLIADIAGLSGEGI